MSASSRRELLVCCLCTLLAVEAVGDEPVPIVPVEVSLGRPVDFAVDILPILRNKCLACHSSAKREGSLVLEDRVAMMTGGDTGPAVVPLKPDESLLYQLATHRAEPVMPPSGNDANAEPFTPGEVGLLRQWIFEGAPGGDATDADLVWQPFPTSVQPVYSLALDASERILAVGRGNRIALIDLLRQIEFARLSNPHLPAGPETAHRDFVHALAFHPQGTLLASGDYRVIHLWQRLPSLRQRIVAPAAISSLAVSLDGTRLATGHADGAIRIWDRTSGKPLQSATLHRAAVRDLQFSESGALLASGDRSGLVGLIRTSDGSTVAMMRTPLAISAIHLDEAREQLVTGHDGGELHVWKLPTTEADDSESIVAEAQLIRSLPAHEGRVTDLTWIRPEPRRLISASRDGTARVYDLAEYRELGRFTQPQPISGLDVGNDGQRIVTTSAEAGVIRVWQAEGQSFKSLREQAGNPLHLRAQQRQSDDLKIAEARQQRARTFLEQVARDLAERETSLTKAQEQLATAHKSHLEAEARATESDKRVAELDRQSGEKSDDAPLKEKQAEAAREQEQNRQALAKALEVSASAQRGVELSQKSVELVRTQHVIANEELLQSTAIEQAAGEALKRTSQRVAQPPPGQGTVALLDGGHLFATGNDDGTVVLWDTKELRPIDVLPGEDGAVTALCVDAEGRLLVGSAAGTVTAWDTTPQWRHIGHLGPSDAAGLDVASSPITGRVLCLDFSPDGTRLVAGSGIPSRSGQVLVWDVETRRVVKSFDEPHSDTVFDIAWSRDGSQLLTGAADRFAKLFTAADGTLLRTFEGHTGHVQGVAWQADSSQIATAGADNSIKVWDVRTGEQRRTISSHTKPVTGVSFRRLTDQIVTGSGDQTVRLFRTGDGNNFRTLNVRAPDGAGEFVHVSLVTADGARILAGTEAGRVFLWDAETGNPLATFDAVPVVPSDSQALAPAETEGSR